MRKNELVRFGWIPWSDRYGAIEPMRVFTEKSVAETALHMIVHNSEPRFTGPFWKCERKLRKLGWYLNPVFAKRRLGK